MREQSGNANVDGVLGDLASLDSVRALAGEVQRRTPRLHVLINNAGAMYPTYRETVDGTRSTPS